MRVLRNIGLLATCRAEGDQEDIHAVRDAALAWEGDTVRWVGPESELPPAFAAVDASGSGTDPARGPAGSGSRGTDEPEVWDAGGRLVVPGLVDCHTHLAFAGWRADEFARRLRGVSYRQIAREGGGILATVRATRAAPEVELLRRCQEFLRRIRRLGVTAVEAKSGYGLDRENELKQLRVYRALGSGEDAQPVEVVPTFLGAHVVPPEYEGARDEYLDLLVDDLIPAVAREGLAESCDAFLEETAFSVSEVRRVLEAARSHGLAVRLHADQLADGGGAALAAELGALSADHLEHASRDGIEDMAREGVVAVNLPLASLYLDQPPMRARDFVEAGVPVAVATDFNPGTAPSYHLPLAMALACTRSRMAPREALKGATVYAARAAGREERLGSLEPGKAADFAVIDAPDVEHWLYHVRPNACVLTVAGGERCWAGPGWGGGGSP